MDNKNKTWVWIIVIVVVLGGIYLLTRGSGTNNSSTNTIGQNSGAAMMGHVVYSVTDAAANMGAVSEINMTVSKVEMHNNVEGWVTVTNSPHTYSLLALKAAKRSEVLADQNVPVGTYDQVRLNVNSAFVKTKTGANSQATLPSNQITIDTNLKVAANQTTSASFDVLADKSLVTSKSGEYVFAPVIKTTIRSNAGVVVTGDSSVMINGGTTDDVTTVGMDTDGTVKLNFQVDAAKTINLNTDGSINLNGTTILK